MTKQENLLSIAKQHSMTARVHGPKHIAVEIPWTHRSGLNGVEIVLCRTYRQLADALGY